MAKNNKHENLETISNEQRFEDLATSLLEAHAEAVRDSVTQGVPIRVVELEGERLISSVVLRTKDERPEPQTQIITYRQGAQSYIKLEDVFFVEDGVLRVVTHRHNDSAQGLLGFGTRHVSRNDVASDDEVDTLHVLLENARPHRNPQAHV